MDNLPQPGSPEFEALIRKAQQNADAKFTKAVMGNGLPGIHCGVTKTYGVSPLSSIANSLPTIGSVAAFEELKKFYTQLLLHKFGCPPQHHHKGFGIGPSAPAFGHAAPVNYGRERIRLGDVEVDTEFSVDWDAWDASMRRDELRTGRESG